MNLAKKNDGDLKGHKDLILNQTENSILKSEPQKSKSRSGIQSLPEEVTQSSKPNEAMLLEFMKISQESMNMFPDRKG